MVLEQDIPTPIRFFSVPRQLSLSVKSGSYINHFGFLPGSDGKLVFVAIFRHERAREDVKYALPCLDYLEMISSDPEVRRANVDARLPVDEAELLDLLQKLVA